MSFSHPALLITGRAGIGKTTVIRKFVSWLGQGNAGGFYTREVRRAGQRTGFEIVTLSGQTGLLATKLPEISFKTAAPFGQYRVNLEAIDSLAMPALRQTRQQDQRENITASWTRSRPAIRFLSVPSSTAPAFLATCRLA